VIAKLFTINAYEKRGDGVGFSEAPPLHPLSSYLPPSPKVSSTTVPLTIAVLNPILCG
jgi:hypothetical protein